MPEEGDYLLSRVGFSKDEKPVLTLQRDSSIIDFQPLNTTLTLEFKTDQRHCIGWYDMRTSERHVCPDAAIINEKYEQCPPCQQRTGFNPAFYNAASVSPQQEELNQKPHILYLAHFGQGIHKVGISHAGRGRARLLEQGARSAIILDTFPTAHIARHYESKIAALPGIAETLQLRKKIANLQQLYDHAAAHKELAEQRSAIERQIGITFTDNEPQSFDDIYFNDGTYPEGESFERIDYLISGVAIGILGSLLFCTQQSTSFFLPLKKYVGYKFSLTYQEKAMTLPAQQMTLF
jgi:hypothetical protein